MKIPFGQPMIDRHEIEAVVEVLNNPILVHGPKADEFEKQFSCFTKSPYCVSVSSCTAGLHLIYFNLGLGAGDEVIVPAMTHVATAHAVELTGALPVFVDAERHTGNIDINKIEAAITSRTKAISIVHFLGMPVNMHQIMAIAKKHDLFVVEDSALAVGSYFDGHHAGLLGDAGVFSFYPVKHMTTAEGGAVITKNQNLAAEIKLKKAFGVDRAHGDRKIPGFYDVTALGFNYRMSEIHAAIGIEQIKKLPQFLEKRKNNFNVLYSKLTEIDELRLFKSTSGNSTSSYYCLSIILTGQVAKHREEIMNGLKRNGVGTSVYYPQPVPRMSYYRERYGYNGQNFPVASEISDCSIALPVGPHLSTEDMVWIVNCLKQELTKVK